MSLILFGRNEKEADYIGLMLMASAGYSPRDVPKKMFEMLGTHKKQEQSNMSAFLEELLLTHPSGEERSRLLSQPLVMSKAMALYEDDNSVCF